MVSIVAGAGLGLAQTSAKTLGSGGIFGAPTQGFLGSNYLINASNGNVIIQNQDEVLTGIGQDVILTRTYNSLGLSSDDNGDNWRESVQRNVSGLTGTVNTVGSTISRTDFDGSLAVYTYDAARSAYVFRNPAGDVDTLTFSSASNRWTWTGGVSRVVEVYDNANSGRILSSTDADGKALSFTYTGANLTRVTDSNGEYVALSWSGNNLTQLSTYKSDGSLLVSRVRYGYDASNRLTSVTVDLTPADNSVSDSNTVTYSYTYDGTSNRVASISETGSNALVAFQYDATTHKVIKVTETAAGGDVRVTSLDYATANHTRVTDAQGNITDYGWDTGGRLTSVSYPTGQTFGYAWDAATGKLASVTDALGYTTLYSYDANGNLIRVLDPAGGQVDRTYDAANNLLTETRYQTPDPDGSGPATASGAMTTRYVYNAQNHLRFVISAQGQVTEYRYNAAGQQVSSINWTANTYDVSSLSSGAAPSEATMAGWVSGIANASTIERTDFTYDFRGNLSTSTAWTATDATGNGLTSATSTVTTFVYDQYGLLLSKQISGRTGAVVYTYDGLGRMVSSTDMAGNLTQIAFDNSNRRTVVTLANGEQTTSGFNALGQIVTRTLSASGAVSQTQTYKYDSLGQLRSTVDAASKGDYTFYDTVGRKVGYIDRLGNLTEFRYDNDGRLIASIAYAIGVSASAQASLFDAGGNPLNVSLASVRPASANADAWTFNIYDAAGRVVQSIKTVGGNSGAPQGQVTTYSYDGEGKLAQTAASANLLSANIVAQYKLNASNLASLASAADRVTRNFYDNAGELIGVLDADGALSRTIYDGAGRVIETVRYATLTTASLRATGSFADLLANVTASANVADRHQYFAYDGQGNLRFTLDANLRPTEMVYDAAGELIRTVSYAGPIAAAASYTLSYIQGQISSLGLATNAATRTSRLVYDGAGRQAFEINAEGAVIGYAYGNLGQLVKVTRYAGTLTAGGDQTLAQMQSWAGSNGNTATDRITRTVYDGLGRAVYDIDPVGFITEYQYDQKNQVVKEIRYPTALAVGDGVTQAGLAAQIGGVPAGAAIQTYAYDANGNRTQVTDPEGIVTAYVYDAFGNVTRATNVTSGSATGFVYDAAGRVVQKTTAYGSSAAATVTYAYDGVGNLIATTDPRGNTTTYTYDALGHLLTQKAPLTVDPSTQVVTYGVTSRQYDAFGNVVATTDPLGNTSWTYYDKLDRAIWVVDAEGYATQTQYSIGNAVTSVRRLAVRASGTGSATVLPTFTTSGGDAETKFTLDKLDRVTSTTDAEGYTESYGLNAFGERVTVTNKLGGVTTNFFSRRGLLTQETLSVGSTRSDGSVASGNIVNTYQYDANGNLIKKVEAAGLTEQRTTIYAYDLDNRLTSKTGDAVTTVDGWTMAQTQNVAVIERYKYDANGNLIEKDDANGNQTLSWYDAGNRKIAELSPLGQLATWTYDANGNVTATRVYGDLLNGSRPAAGGTAPSAVNAANFRETDYGYDANNRLVTTTAIGNGSGVAVAQYQGSNYTSVTKAVTTTLQYDADGNVIVQTDGNGGKIYSWYDRLGQKIAQVDQSLYMTRWTFDQEGNVTAETRYATPVTGTITAGGNPPAINLMANSDFSRGIDQWLIGYNPDGILKAGSPYTITNVNGTGTNTIKTDFNATAAGQTLSLASVINTPVVAGDHLAVQIGVEGQGNGVVGLQKLSVWFFDANGNTVSGATVATLNGPQAYNTKLGGFADVPQGAVSMRLELYMTTAGAGQGTFLIAQPMVASVAQSQTQLPGFSAATGAVAGLADARTTLFTYDRNGRRLTETRLNVQTASVSGQSVSEAKVSATVTYTYNGLGLVTSKREATGDTTSYGYDSAGRQTSITGPAFTDYTGASVSNLQQMSYDGLGNVTRSVENGSRVTSYSYGAEGRLASSTDPLGNVTSYAYDAGGRISATTSLMVRSDGSRQYVARALKYDAAGHEISENTFTSSDGSNWTLTQSATDYFYDAYGAVIARGTNSGRDIVKAQEFNDYDAAGRVWRTNFGNGVTKAYLFDANGNATVLLQSMGSVNLKTGGSYVGAVDAQAMLGDSGISKTFSVYDARNQLTDTIQSTSNNAGSSVINATQSSTGPQGTVYFDSNADVNGSNRYGTGIGATYTSSNGVLGATRQGQVYASGWFSKLNANGKPLGIYDVSETITWSDLPIHGGGNITFTNIYYPYNSFTVPAGNGSGSYFVSYRAPATGFSAAQAYQIKQTLPSGASVILGGIDASFYEEDEDFQAWGEPTYLNPLLQIPNETTSTSVIRLLVRAQGTSGPYTVVNMSPLIRADGNAEPGMFTYDLTQAPFNSLASNSSWDIRYLAFDANGTLTDAKNGILNVDGNGNPSVNLSSTPVGGPGQTLATWDGPYYTLLFTGLPSGTQHLHVYYRLAGSGGAFTSLDVNPQVGGGAYGQTGWWSGRPPADGQTYEYWVQPEDGGNMPLGARSYGTYNSISGPSGLTQYAPASELVHFNPPSGASVTSQRMRYFANGAWSDWINYGAGGQWSFDAGSLAPDFYSSYSYPIQYETYNGSTLVSQATATLTLGYAGQGISNYSNLQSIPAQVVLNSKQSGGSTIKLYWRDAGSTGAYTPVTLTRNASGAYSWDVDTPPVRPSSGTRRIEYYYDVYDSGGNRLNTLTGSDHVQGYIDISSDHYTGISDTEIRWTINTANGSQYLVHRQQSYNAFGDIVSETDGRGNVTRLVYNTEGKLISKIAPQVNVTDEAGNTTLTNPTEYYYYDASGRQVAQRDANGNLTTQLLLAGTGYGGAQAKVAAVYLPGSTTTNGYDVWGDLRKVTDGLGNATVNVYDANHNLIEVDHAQRSGGNSNGVQLKDYYAYDVMGQRIRHWTSQYGSGVFETTDYDVMGRVIKTVTMAGEEADYAYVWYPGIDPSGGYAHISTGGLGNFGGWQTITSTSAGVTKLQNSDIFGNVAWRRDFGGRNYGYTYDLAGHLVNQTNSAGQNITYTYYENGYVKSINDNTLHMLSTFQYDNDGNRTLETYNSTNASGVTDGTSVFYQNATITYDAMNRIVEFKDPKADITYKYDAVGNRRNVHSVYVDGTGNSLIPPQDYWYKYDGQNRFTVTMGVLANGSIDKGSTGVALTYDAAGNRATATYGHDGHTERYSYTADGYLENTWNKPADQGEALFASRTSDALGRVTQYTEYEVAGGAATLSRSSSYDADNRTMSDTTNSVKNSVTSTTTQTYDYKAWNASTGSYSGPDQGVVTHIHAVQSQSGSSTPITTETAYNYVWWDEAKQSSIRINASDPSNPNSGSWAPGVSSISYDVNGHTTQMVDNTAIDGAKTTTYRNDAYGQVLVREQSQNGVIRVRQQYYYFDGKRIGDVGNDGPSANQVDYVQQLAQAASSKQSGMYRYGKPVASADFDENYQPINAGYPAATAGTYTINTGDTLQSIASSLWGDSSLWYLLADANGIGMSTQLTAGQRLIVPNKVANFHNNTSTFKVYNPGEAIGDTLPTLPNEPAPPPTHSSAACGGFGAILLAVVAVAVAVVSQGTLSTLSANMLGVAVGSTTATVAGGALAAAAGSIVSQGLGVATGLQDSFSWSAVGMAALGGAVGGGLGKINVLGKAATGAAKVTNQVVRGALTSAVTQGIGIATGLQSSFDWGGVAAAGMGAGIGGSFGKSANKAFGNYGGQVTTGVAAGLAASAAESLVTGRDFGDTVIANLPGIIANTIANTVGNLVAEGIAGSKTRANPSQAAQQSGSAGSQSPGGAGELGASASSDAEPGDIVVTARRGGGYNPVAAAVAQAVAQTATGSNGGGDAAAVAVIDRGNHPYPATPEDMSDNTAWQLRAKKAAYLDAVAKSGQSFTDNELNVKRFDELIAGADAREAPGVAASNVAEGEILRAGLFPFDVAAGSYNLLTGKAGLRDYLAVASVLPAGKILGPLGRAAERAFLSLDDFATLPKAGTIDANLIRFSQDSAKATFKPPFGSVDDFATGLANKSIDPASISPIRIAEKDGMIFTLDNRRLYAFQKAGLDVPYQKLDTIPKRELFKFTTQNDGVSIRIR